MSDSVAAEGGRRSIPGALVDIHCARSGEVPLLHECDEDASLGGRVLAEALAERACWVAFFHERAVGYVALQHTFFGSGRITRLAVHPAFRRRGIGSLLLAFAEDRCQSAQLFVSVQRTDRPMRDLLRQRGYRRSGMDDLSYETDQVVVYAKRVTVGGADSIAREERGVAARAEAGIIAASFRP